MAYRYAMFGFRLPSACGFFTADAASAVRYASRLAVLAAVLIAAPGCAGPNARSTGTFGAIAGGATGAAIGAASGNPGKGLVVGAVAGGLGGSAIGRAADIEDQKRAAIAQASYEQTIAHQHAVAASQVISTHDLITMTHNGVSEDVIRTMLLQRGTSVDLSPAGVIYLKQQGVADAVILAAQNASTQPPLPASAPVAPIGPPGPLVPVVPIEEIHEVHVVRPRPRRRTVVITNSDPCPPPPCRIDRRVRASDFRGPLGVKVEHHWTR